MAAGFSRGDWQYVRRPEGYIYRGRDTLRVTTPAGRSLVIRPGDRVTTRQQRNLRYQAAGWRSRAEYERFSRAIRSRDRVRALAAAGFSPRAAGIYTWARHYSKIHRLPLSRVLAPDSDFMRLLVRAERDRFDTRPDGPFARLLSSVNLRPVEADWNVGETNPS